MKLQCRSLTAALVVIVLIVAAGADAALVNVAPKGVASQSTTDFGGVASRGNDGNTNGAFGGGSVTHTAAADAAPTWQVDLGEPLTIARIKLWNRTDCCSNRLTSFRVSVLKADLTEDYGNFYFTDGSFPDTSSDGFAIDLPPGTNGQIVRVQRQGADVGGGLWLSLAEVEVFVDVAEPQIVQQPQGATVEEGQCHRFTVGLINIEGATSVTYQWKKNGDALPGETGSTLFLENLAADDGGSYTVEVDVDGTLLTSDAAQLTVAPRNLARGRPASQVTTAFGGVASRAVDGNTNGAYGGNSVTHTDNTPNGWWEVDLGEGVTVDSIVIWGRSDCCTNRLSNFRVSVLDDARTEVFGKDEFTDLTFPNPAGYAVAVGGAAGKFVRIQRLGPDNQGNNYLSLAEVQVFGDAPLPEAPKSLARRCGTLARQSTTNGAFTANLAIDGNLGNFTHTVGADASATWEVELVEEEEIGAVVLYNRTSCCGSRLRDIVVSVFDAAGGLLYRSELLNPENALGTYPNGPPNIRVDLQFEGPGVVLGKMVRVERVADPDLSGSGGQGNVDEANVLSLGEVEICPPALCPPTGDTHCAGLTVTGPPENRPGVYMLTFASTDDSGDEVLHTVRAESDSGAIITVGPQAGTISLNLGIGSWSIVATADDDPSCPDEADDAVCTTTIDVACTPGNIAVYGAATQSTMGFDGVPSRAIDCNNDGVYGNGSITHTAVGDAAPWWELDLLTTATIHRIVLWNRSDCCSDRLSNFRASLLDDERAVVWSGEFFTNGTSAGRSFEITGVRGYSGSIFRIDILGPAPSGAPFLSLAEVEVYEFTCPTQGDTHCDGLAVAAGPGGWIATASASDDSGDAVRYTFTARSDGAVPIVVGPQSQNTATLALTPGQWTVSVDVDDDACPDIAGDASCSQPVIVPEPCPAQGDTHCNGLTVVQGEGVWTATAAATDDSGDAISYTFVATDAGGEPFVQGPQAENTATFGLTPGTWTVTVSVDDDDCPDVAADATCRQEVTVAPPGGRQVPGDCNQDGVLNIADASCVFGVLFLGEPELFPCGDGSPADAGNVLLFDWQPDARIDLSDGVGLLNFLFSGGPRHPLAIPDDEIDGCVRIEGCPDNPRCP
jgi:hypothetical protein